MGQRASCGQSWRAPLYGRGRPHARRAGRPHAGSVLLGLVSLAMTAAVVGAAGPEHTGVASGILNAARQARGVLGVPPLGSLLGSGRAPNLWLPLAAAAGGYLVALAMTWIGIRNDR